MRTAGVAGFAGMGKAARRDDHHQPETVLAPQVRRRAPPLSPRFPRWQDAGIEHEHARARRLCAVTPYAIGWSRSGLFEVAALTLDETSYAMSRSAG